MQTAVDIVLLSFYAFVAPVLNIAIHAFYLFLAHIFHTCLSNTHTHTSFEYFIHITIVDHPVPHCSQSTCSNNIQAWTHTKYTT